MFFPSCLGLKFTNKIRTMLRVPQPRFPRKRIGGGACFNVLWPYILSNIYNMSNSSQHHPYIVPSSSKRFPYIIRILSEYHLNIIHISFEDHPYIILKSSLKPQAKQDNGGVRSCAMPPTQRA